MCAYICLPPDVCQCLCMHAECLFFHSGWPDYLNYWNSRPGVWSSWFQCCRPASAGDSGLMKKSILSIYVQHSLRTCYTSTTVPFEVSCFTQRLAEKKKKTYTLSASFIHGCFYITKWYPKQLERRWHTGLCCILMCSTERFCYFCQKCKTQWPCYSQSTLHQLKTGIGRVGNGYRNCTNVRNFLKIILVFPHSQMKGPSGYLAECIWSKVNQS